MYQRRVIVLGETGTGNLGDDHGFALLRAALVRYFAEFGVEAEVIAQAPPSSLVETGHAVITGCGTLLDQVGYLYVERLVKESYRVPIAIVGTGMVDPTYAKPTSEGDRLLNHVLATACYVWRRAYNGPDVGWLAGWRGRDEVAADAPCAINAGFACHNLLPLATERLAAIRSKLTRPSVLVAAFKNDLPYLEPLARKSESIMMIDGSDESWTRLAEFSTVLCLRVHLGVFAACCGVQPILPNYSRKVREVFEKTTVEPTLLQSGFTDDHLVALLDGPAPRVARRAVEVAQYDCLQHARNAAYYITHAWGLI